MDTRKGRYLAAKRGYTAAPSARKMQPVQWSRYSSSSEAAAPPTPRQAPLPRKPLPDAAKAALA